jgi:hypothetical protein
MGFERSQQPPSLCSHGELQSKNGDERFEGERHAIDERDWMLGR